MEKAYNNGEFLHSPEARTIRMLSEYYYPLQQFEKKNINRAIVFFGSARSRQASAYQTELENMKKIHTDADEIEKSRLSKQMSILQRQVKIGRYYDAAVELSRKIAEWSKKFPEPDKFYICSGGGPGMMQAANKGASLAGEKNIGLNISLPFEQNSNHYVTEELNFEFHYFFMRKFWFVNLAAALICFPGGFGTMDEIFETLTLLQTNKIKKKLPVLLFGKDFWKSLINFDTLVDCGMISPEDLTLFKIFDDVDEAFEFLVFSLENNSNIEKGEIEL